MAVAGARAAAAPRRIAKWQRYRDIAAECRERARLARSPKTRAGLEVLRGAMMKSLKPS